jgi:predicted heme/steroid binding protein
MRIPDFVADVNNLGLVVSAGLGLVILLGIFSQKRKGSNTRPTRRIREGQTEFTTEEVAQFDGKSADVDEPILTIIDGLVYDLKKGREFYGEGGPYHPFVGRDCTRLLAKNQVSDKTDTGLPLTDAEKEQLEKWKEFFNNKYSPIGKVVAK